ncbi:hypothetical protein P3T36_006134 [Kitasatospora sp. MAP12-15]|uniref:hypothetical protein n=1 Tax=unclassified Kitasatospora TaxID=2633591 RepID=UPI0024742CF0|nr:hypothetical protein [Kitasatospora sp. MAP12-44]MDH6110612.1 hypothetical protein [Kitasatospora sp. MAP12-44]
MSQPAPTIDELKQSMVESFMAIIGAPDDAQTARDADQVVRTLDALLIAEAAANPLSTV